MTSTLKKKSPKAMGRPTKYSKELAESICKRVGTHTWGIQKICATYPDMPHPDTIREWRLEKEDFSAMYARAKCVQADLLAEDCLDIADDGSKDIKTDKDGFQSLDHEFVQRSRVRIDTRKWLASKLIPKVYGEKNQIEELKDENERVKIELQELRKQLNKKNKKEY